jgi:hypothetical protein
VSEVLKLYCKQEVSATVSYLEEDKLFNVFFASPLENDEDVTTVLLELEEKRGFLICEESGTNNAKYEYILKIKDTKKVSDLRRFLEVRLISFFFASLTNSLTTV